MIYVFFDFNKQIKAFIRFDYKLTLKLKLLHNYYRKRKRITIIGIFLVFIPVF